MGVLKAERTPKAQRDLRNSPEPSRPGPSPACGDLQNWAGGSGQREGWGLGDTLTLRSLWTTPIW